VYALGTIEWRYPNISVDKEFAQAGARVRTEGMTDAEVVWQVLSQHENRYLARQLCWVLCVQGLETYILYPRDPADFELLIQTTEGDPKMRISAVIGIRGQIAGPPVCNGLLLPTVGFDQIYTFARDEMVALIPNTTKATDEDFRRVAREVFDRIMQMTDNSGATDEYRALNYLAMRYPGTYATAVAKFNEDFSLTDVSTRFSPLSATRRIVDIIFSYTHRKNDFTEKHFVRVDVTEEFPFLFSKMSLYYDR
jgi:hypothetical protein